MPTRVRDRLTRLLPWLRRRQVDTEIQKELDLHLDLETEQNLKLGMSPPEAARSARLSLGTSSLIREDARAVWAWGWLDVLSQDIGYGFRTLRRSPGFALLSGIHDVRTRYFGQDPQGALVLADDLIQQFPHSVELRAWRTASTARTTHAAEAIADAQELVAEYPDDGWAWFALAAAALTDSEDEQDGLEASERALVLLPTNADIVWIRASVLVAANRHDEAIELLNEYNDGANSSAELLVTKGDALYSQATRQRGRDPERIETALALLEQAREQDPLNVNAHYRAGVVLSSMRRNAEAMPLFEEAVSLSPGAIRIRTRHWRAIIGVREIEPEEKRRRVSTGAEELLAHTRNRPQTHPPALLAITNAYTQLGATDEVERINAQILAEYPDSREAEWVLYNRFSALRTEALAAGDADAERQREYRRLLWEFIARPTHHLAALDGAAYLSLFIDTLDDSETDPAELLEIVRGMVEWDERNPHLVFAHGATALAEKTNYYAEAAAIARKGIDEGRKRIESQRDSFATQGDYENAVDRIVGLMHDALGWVYFQEGRLDEGETELLRAYELNPKERSNLFHLGQLYEAKNEVRNAEDFYVRGLSVQAPGDNRSETALQELYAREQGGSDGFLDYLEGIKTREATDRKAKILAARLEDAEPAPPFELANLAGETVALADLEGQIVVVNFWGIWCGWCVTELPDLQRLHDEFADDPEVTVITINNDENPDDVPPWIQERLYTFPVLFDNGYLARTGVFAFPTTWFLDRDGRVTFEKSGWSQELVQEFTWRIEALRNDE